MFKKIRESFMTTNYMPRAEAELRISAEQHRNENLLKELADLQGELANVREELEIQTVRYTEAKLNVYTVREPVSGPYRGYEMARGSVLAYAEKVITPREMGALAMPTDSLLELVKKDVKHNCLAVAWDAGGEVSTSPTTDGGLIVRATLTRG